MKPLHPHILIIAGSPRAEGNSMRLAELAATEARLWGIKVTLASPVQANTDSTPAFQNIRTVNFADISPCIACGECSDSGVCIFDDEANEIFEYALDVDAILWISPLYFASVPSQLKKLVDRTQTLYSRSLLGKAKTKEERKPAWLVLVGGGGDPYGYAAAVPPLAYASRMMEAELMPELVLIGPDEAGDIDRVAFANFKESAQNFFENSMRSLSEQAEGCS